MRAFSQYQTDALNSQRPLYVEISPILEKRLTGIGRFAARLVEALARIVPLTLFRSGGNDEISLDGRHLSYADSDILSWKQDLLRRPRQQQKSRSFSQCAAVYTNLRPGRRLFRRELGILYDFTTELLPWAHEPRVCREYGEFFANSSALCDKLLSISQSTKRDAGRLCAKRDPDIVVGYPGPSMCVKQHAYGGACVRRSDMVLVVSTLEPRKNVKFVIDWFRCTRKLPSDMQLWWVGSPAWWASSDFLRSLRSSIRGNCGRRVRFLGAVSDRRLCELYQQAAFTIYPSLYEGFGFPILDSLRHGTPVLSSFNSSLQEFAGPGVHYFDPYDPASLDDACRSLWASGLKTVPREDLGRFSWERLAQQVVSLCA